MNSLNLRKTTIIIFAFLIFLLAANAINAGLGISPSRITVKHLLRDSHYEKTFVLSRSDSKEAIDFRVLVEGSIKDWITTDKGTEFTWPSGQQRFPITIIVKPPSGIPNGLYEGSIRFVSVPKSQKELEGSSVAIALAAAIQVNFTVTGEQVLEYTISAVTIKVVEEGSPIGIILTIDNTGNVKARPTKVHVDIYDKFKKILLESHDITEMELVDAFKRDDIMIEIPTKLGVEQYWAVVSIYRDDLLLEEESVVFEIVEVGSLQRQGDIAYSEETTTAKESIFDVKAEAKDSVTFSIIALVIKAVIVILGVIAGVVIFFRMKKKIRKTMAPPKKLKKSITIENEIVKAKEEALIKTEETQKTWQEKTKEAREKWFKSADKLTIDLYKVGEDLIIQSTIAGVKPEDLEITTQGNIVTIKGARINPDGEPNKSYYYQECCWGPFFRQIILPEEADPSGAEASFQEGILLIRIPCIEKGKKRIIAIK